jgi:hypothetical protein
MMVAAITASSDTKQSGPLYDDWSEPLIAEPPFYGQVLEQKKGRSKRLNGLKSREETPTQYKGTILRN